MLKPPDLLNDTSEPIQRDACRLYQALTRTDPSAGAAREGEEPSLGGKLLYSGELDLYSRALVVAGNVAGCATLAATADIAVQKQSIRDGIVDFLVNSLDEALRILKNEIRQRKTVAVCVGAAPEGVEREMVERGVEPDLVFAGSPEGQRILPKFGEGTRAVQLVEPDGNVVFLTWQIEQAPARWMPKLDGAALGCVDANSWEHRWIRLAGRFLGRSGLAQRVFFCDRNSAKKILERFAELVREGEIGAEVSGILAADDESRAFRMRPGEALEMGSEMGS